MVPRDSCTAVAVMVLGGGGSADLIGSTLAARGPDRTQPLIVLIAIIPALARRGS